MTPAKPTSRPGSWAESRASPRKGARRCGPNFASAWRKAGAQLGAHSYFCLPYHSWEKGTVENTNGQLRYYFPKCESFPYEEVDPEWVREEEAELKDRPRRILGYRTANEVYQSGGKRVG
jgi:transposase, IS30 family